jgi:hypothetical protein
MWLTRLEERSIGVSSWIERWRWRDRSGCCSRTRGEGRDHELLIQSDLLSARGPNRQQ